MTTKYPVDSTYFPCCHSIGRHGRHCKRMSAERTPQKLDDAVNRLDLLRQDLHVLLRELSPDAPVLAALDPRAAIDHLRQAAVLVDKAGDRLEKQAVTR